MWIKRIEHSKGISYQVRWRDGRQKSKTFRKLAHAQDFLDQLKGKPKAPVTATFGHLVDAAERMKVLTVDDLSRLRNHVLPLLEDVFLGDLERHHQLDLEEYWAQKKSERTGKSLTPKSVANVQSATQTLVKWAVDKGIMTQNPFKFKKPKTSRDHWTYWTISERDRFYSETFPKAPDFADSVLFACLTGLRLGEQMALRREDICFESGIMSIRRTFDYSGRYRGELDPDGNKPYPKNGKHRYQPLSPLVVEILSRRGGRYFFQDLRDLKNHAAKTLRRYARLAQVKEIRWHDLRHTCASSIAMQGHSMLAVKEWLGHSDLSMTQRYSHLSPSYLKGVGDSLMSPELLAKLSSNDSSKITGAGNGTRTRKHMPLLRVVTN